MINLLLVGQADHDNFGDSLIFSLYVKMLNSLGQYNIFLLKPSNIFVKRLNDDGINNISVVDSYDEIDILNISNIILVPGGFLGCPDITDILWQFKWNKNSYIKNILENINNYDKKTMIHGVEFGPFLRPFVLPHVRKFLTNNNIANIYSRNNSGREYITSFIDRKVEVLPDFVMSIKSFDKYNVCDKKYELGLHATGKLFAKNHIAKKFLNLIEKYILNKGIKNVLIFSDQKVSGDVLTNINIFIERLKSSNINIDFKNYDGHQKTINCISSCSTIVTSKLHVGVVGLSYGTKIISISSHPKLSRFYTDIGLNIFSINYFLSSSRQKLKLIDKVYNMNEDMYFNEIKYKSDDVYQVYKKTFLDFLNSN